MSWADEAACYGVPERVMFPWPDSVPLDEQTPEAAGEALALRRRCPVTSDCLADARRLPPYGVRGGLTPSQRLRCVPAAAETTPDADERPLEPTVVLPPGGHGSVALRRLRPHRA
ncbi:MAG TPA: WhiB family transcriptional regulator [Iamia sp.]|nr:WhiB family transcriptional regulator [Iamia sp.]